MKKNNNKDDDETAVLATSVRMSGIFMVMILVASATASFSLGRYVQTHVPPSLQRTLQQTMERMIHKLPPLVANVVVVTPPPSRNSHLFLHNKDDIETSSSTNHETNDHDKIDDDDDDVAISNGAEHLMVDVTNADPAFLRSPDRLEAALLTLLQGHYLNGEQNLLSLRHTNHLDERGGGGGISITILLLDSHVFLHAWPSIGVLTLDIYKSQGHTSVSQDNEDNNNHGSEGKPYSLLTLRPVIEKLFSIGGKSGGNAAGDDDEHHRTAAQSAPPPPPPHFYWAIKHRGLDYDTYKEDPSDSADFRMHYLGRRAFTRKELVSKIETPFQTYEVYDLVDIRDAYQRTDRILFLDYVSQSSRLGLEPYHEALVHPALFTHPHPKRVAIVGGGEGATLREVLKHNTVEQVVMIEIDGVMMNASRTALLEWNDCSDLVGSNAGGSCFDDPRAKVYAADAARWFLDRFHEKDIAEEEKFDVIIMDAL
jgi:S-adenosylmethionine/arginine decarboxylase-like enzyme